MALFAFPDRRYEIDLIVFDKDGTLVDFHHFWGQRCRNAVETLIQRVRGSDATRQALYRTLGYDPVTGWPDSDGPLAVTSTAKLATVAATVLHQSGIGWYEAERYVAETFLHCLSLPPDSAMVRSVGDVQGLLDDLRQSHLRFAIATSDDRATTEATLPFLGIQDYIDIMVCGDDPLPSKPAPEALWHIATTLGIAPRRIMFVGDTASDIATGTEAGVGCRVGVLSGTGNRADLDFADVVLDSIHELRHALHTTPSTSA